MVTNGLLDKSRVEIKLGDYGVAPANALSDVSILPRVQDYRRQTGSRMYPLDKSEINKKIPTAEYFVSRKIDGEFTVLVLRSGLAFSINPGGTIRLGLPWQEEAAKLLSQAGITDAMIAGELYVSSDQGKRERVHDVTSVARQPDSQSHLEQLRFGVFDLMSLNEQTVESPYKETWATIEKIFGGGRLAHPVETKQASDSHAIEKLFNDWVEEKGAEGIVVRSDSGGFFKIKPRHTLDAAVIGFTESSDERFGMMHDLLLAVMRKDGALQVLCRVGGGFTEDLRREMFSDLKDIVVDSEYAEVNSDHVAYQMVKPKWVVEISCLDMISQTTRGGPVNRMALHWNPANTRYEIIRRLPLVSVISPQFIRKRDDKRVTPDDIRVKQIADRVEVPLIDRDASQMTLPKSELMKREVFTKQLKGETMVRKFLMWKTNKETDSDIFPAFVIHYTDFSPNRKAPLSRDVRVSSSHDQILSQWESLKEANIKKGWEPVKTGDSDDSETASISTDEKASSVKQAASESSTNKKTVKKKAVKKTAKTKTASVKTDDKPATKEKVAKKTAAKKSPAKKETKKAKKKS